MLRLTYTGWNEADGTEMLDENEAVDKQSASLKDASSRGECDGWFLPQRVLRVKRQIAWVVIALKMTHMSIF